jgi:beta-galactosidase GanA
MTKTVFFPGLAAGLLAAFLGLPAQSKPVTAIPHLQEEHGATQLVVDGAPFLIRGGELENSSASSMAFMDGVWPKLEAMHLNTALTPVYWELIEPQEGHFDFRSVDGMIEGARKHHMHLVLLWFGSWKNSMSSYVPAWVKRDQTRFPRAQRSDGTGMEILSALSPNNLAVDSQAFVALMRHLRETDTSRTVLMVQVENEVGMIPEARDHSAAANAAFAAPVPAALTDYLTKNYDSLAPELKTAWQAHGEKTGADWADTFGESPATDEMFNAWTEGHFTGEVAAAGKAVYPLPMFVNAALMRPGKLPGQYPSGGPLPQVFDVWRAAAPAIDFLSPDLYFPNFVEWTGKYAQAGKPFFIPETGRVNAPEMAANAFYAFGQLNSMGFSPYAPEYIAPDQAKTLGEAYDMFGQLAPLILANQGNGKMVGIRPPATFDGTVDLDAQRFTLGNYTFDVHFREPPPISTGAKAEIDIPGAHGGLIIQLGPDEYLFAGTGMIVNFETGGAIAGIESIWEGRFVNGVWVPGRNLNGDDSNQGRHLSLPPGKFTIRRVRLYRYH